MKSFYLRNINNLMLLTYVYDIKICNLSMTIVLFINQVLIQWQSVHL